MAGIGPAPYKPAESKRRQTPKPGFTQLPYEGRTGDAPLWPLGDSTFEEWQLWCKLWTLPQATVWERIRCEDTVALYVRCFLHVADHPSDDKMLNQVRQLDSKLGLSPRSMQDLRWEIEAAPLEEDVVPAANGHAGRAYVPKSPSG